MSTPNGPQENPNEKQENSETIVKSIHNDIQQLITNNYRDTKTGREDLWKILKNDSDAVWAVKKQIEKEIYTKYKQKTKLNWTEDVAKKLDEKWHTEQAAKNILWERARLEAEAETRLKKWFAPLSATQKAEWKAITENLTYQEIKNLRISATKMKEIIVGKNAANASLFQEKDIPDIANEILDLLPDDKAEEFRRSETFRENMEFFAVHGRLDENQIEEILKTEGIDADTRKKLAKILFPTIPFAIVKKYKIASETEIENFENTVRNILAQKIFGKDFNLLTDKEQTDVTEMSYEFADAQEFDSEKLDATKLNEEILKKITSKKDNIHADLRKIIDEQNQFYEEYIEEEKDKIDHIGDMKIFLKNNLTPEQKQKIVGWNDAIDRIGAGKFLKYTQRNGQRGFFKIVKDDTITTAGVEQSGITIQRYALTQSGDMFEWKPAEAEDPRTFKNFINIFIAQLKNDDNTSIEITDQVDPAEKWTDILGIHTLDAVKNIVDEMDKENADKGFEPGLTFSVEVEDDKGNRNPEMVTLLDTSGGMISMRLFDGKRVDVTYNDFVEGLDHGNMNIRRLWNVSTAENFVKNGKTSKISGWENELEKLKGLVFKNGKILMEDSKPDNLDNLKHLTEEERKMLTKKEKEVWGFKHPKKNIFIHVDFDTDGRMTATIWDYKTQQERNPLRYNHENTKNLSEKEQEKRKEESKQIIKEWKVYKNVTYALLLQMMQDKWATEPIPKTQTIETYDKKWKPVEKEMDPLEAYEAEIAFKNGEHMKDYSSPITFISLWSVYYGAKHVIDYHKKKWEHKSEVKSAYAFMRLNKYLGSGGVDAMSRLINTTKDDLKNRYKGKNMRKYIEDNILKSNSAKPHEILAALMITVEMAGHLYPDSSLQEHLSKNYIWFNKVCYAIGVEPKSAFKKCYEKTAQENDKIRNYVAEEDLITRLFKSNQWLEMVQAIGGGAPFWKAADSAKREQTAKWESEANDFSSEMGRAIYAVSKMESNEYEIAVGAIPKIFDHGTSPQALSPFFVVAMSNATSYVNDATLANIQKLKTSGVTFHAVPFCKNKELADTYKDTIEIALRKKMEIKPDPYSNIYRKYFELYTKAKNAWYKHDPNLIKETHDFWVDNADHLQQLLQWVDPILQVSLANPNTSEKDKETIRDYLQTLHNTGSLYPGLGGVKSQKDHYSLLETYGTKSSHIFLATDGDNPIYKSLALPLDALEIDKVKKDMSGASRNAALQLQVIEYFKVIRDNDTFQANPVYQKEQFKISYNEMMKKLMEKTWEITREQFEGGKHSDLKHFGIIEKQLGIKMDFDTFEKVRNSGGRLSFADLVDQDPDIFENFLNSSRSRATYLHDKISKNTSNLTFDILAANDENYHQ